MGLFGSKKKEQKMKEKATESTRQTIPMKDCIRESVVSANGMGLVDFNGVTVEQDTKIREYAEELGIIYRVDRKNHLMDAISGTKFVKLSEQIANNTRFAVIYFDNMNQLQDFTNFIDSMNIANSTRESRVFAYMLNE